MSRNRFGTSEAKNAEESCLGEGPQRITYERPLAAAKMEVDGILQEPVRIVSGLPSAVPALVKEPKSEASGLSSSIPLLNQLTDGEFQNRATNRVSEILLRNLENDSCPELPAGMSVEDHDDDEEEDDDEPNAQLESQAKHFLAFIDPLSLAFADDLVGEIMESMNETVSSQDYHVAAFDVVEYITEGMKDLVETARGIGAVSVKKICATSQRMFSAIKNVVGNLFSKSAYSDRKEETTMAYARNVICDVIISMQSDLRDFKSAENVEQAALIHKILGAMLNEVQMIDIKIGKDRPQSHPLPSRSSADSEVNDQNRLRDTPDSPEVPIKGISPVLVCSNIGMKDSSLSSKCSHETITHVVDTIFESGKRVHITRRLEELMSDTKMMEYSHNIAGEVQKLLKSYHGVQTISVPVGKSLSDSVLYKLRPRAVGKNEIPSGFIYGYVEEAVKRLVLSSLFPSISSSTSEEFGSTVDVFTQVMTQVVMETLSTQSQDNIASSRNSTDDIKELVKDNQKLSDKQAQDTKTPSFTSSSDNVLPHIFDEHGERGTSLSHLSLLESNNYASLVSMLVIQLLKKINSLHQNVDQNTLPDNVLDMSNDLIGDILNELNKTFGIRSDGHHPQEVNIHQIFRVVYKELTQDFGSENILCSALKSQNPSLTSSLVEKLTKAIVKPCSPPSTPASACLPPSQTAIGPQKKREEKTRNNMFPFRLKMPTFNWKVEYHAYHLVHIGHEVLYCTVKHTLQYLVVGYNF